MQRLLIAIPVLNEAAILRTTVHTLASFVREHLPRFDTTIAIVDNGSTDQTQSIGESLSRELPTVTYRRLNEQGKGLAIRTAWQEHDADIYAFMDADLSTDLNALPVLIDAIRHGADVAVGSRFHPESTISRSMVRKVASWTYRYMLQAMLDLETEDLPCGFKAATADVVKKILPTVADNGWFFDSEFVARAEHAHRIVKEVPVQWHDAAVPGRISKVSILRVATLYIKKTWALRKTLKINTPQFLLSRHDLPWIGLFAIIIAFLYGNTLTHGFVHDDQGQIVENPYVHSIKYIGRAFTGCIWEGQMSCDSTAYYRPLHNLSYIITDIISSRAAWYHFINLLYFLVAAALVFGLARYISKKTSFAAITVGIFLFHPINTEVVNWVACVPEFLVTIFSLIGIGYYIRYRETEKHRYLAYAIVCYFFGLISKETAASLPIIFLLLDVFVFKKNLRGLWKNRNAYGAMAGVFAGYFLMRASVLGSMGIGAGPGRFGTLAFTEKIYAYITLCASYVKKLLLPWPLLGFYPFTISARFSSPEFIGSAVIVGSLMVMAALIYWRKKPIAFMAMLWIPVFLLPVLVFFNKIGENVFAERYLFLPSIGLGMLAASLLVPLWDKNRIGKAIVGLLMVLGMIAGSRAIHARNPVWSNDATFYSDTLKKNPAAYAILYNLANGHLKEGKIADARSEYKTIIEHDPNNLNIAKIYNNLGMTYIRDATPDRATAIEYFQKATTITKNPPQDAYSNLGAAYLEDRQFLKALRSFCMAAVLPGRGDDATKAFKEISSVVAKAKETKPESVYADIVYGTAFHKSTESRIAFTSGGCDSSGCYYVFTPTKDTEVFAPILTALTFITAEPDMRILIPIRRTRIDPENNNIIVETDPSHMEPHKKFIFPSCDGAYYEVSVTKTPRS